MRHFSLKADVYILSHMDETEHLVFVFYSAFPLFNYSGINTGWTNSCALLFSHTHYWYDEHVLKRRYVDKLQDAILLVEPQVMGLLEIIHRFSSINCVLDGEAELTNGANI